MGGCQHVLGGLVWDDVEGQKSFPVSAGFKFTAQRLLVQVVQLSHHTHHMNNKRSV